MFCVLMYTQFSDALTQFRAVFVERAHTEKEYRRTMADCTENRYATGPISSLRPIGGQSGLFDGLGSGGRRYQSDRSV